MSKKNSVSAAKQTYNIEGMHCASCALLIENNLKNVAGIKKATVNFATQKATGEFDGKSATRLFLAVMTRLMKIIKGEKKKLKKKEIYFY